MKLILSLASTATPVGLRSAVVHPLRELRKFLFSPAGDYLYVANGSNELNQVLSFTPSRLRPDRWQYEGIYASRGLSHPFDIIFGFQKAVFVASQDNGCVTKYDSKGAAPKSFASGFAAVRGLAFDGTCLYIADSGKDVVVPFDASGKAARSISVSQPAHMLVEPLHGWLFISSEKKNSVVAWNPATPETPPLEVIANTSPKIDHTSGIALQPGLTRDGATLYVASRVGREVLSFTLDFSKGKPEWMPRTTKVALSKAQLGDEPEFVGIQGGLYG